jgi:hypothetical protein
MTDDTDDESEAEFLERMSEVDEETPQTSMSLEDFDRLFGLAQSGYRLRALLSEPSLSGLADDIAPAVMSITPETLDTRKSAIRRFAARLLNAYPSDFSRAGVSEEPLVPKFPTHPDDLASRVAALERHSHEPVDIRTVVREELSAILRRGTGE